MSHPSNVRNLYNHIDFGAYSTPNSSSKHISNALLEHHPRLRLPPMLTNYRRLIAEHPKPLPYLADLAALESAKRQENGVKARHQDGRGA